MSEAIVAKRYAEALFQLGSERSTLEKLMEEFEVVLEVFQSNEQLYTFLEHPSVNNTEKKQFLSDVFRDLSNDVVNTIKMLVERHRIEYISEIINEFIQIVNDKNGIAEVQVYSVRELSDIEKQELEKGLAKQHNKKAVILENIVDPSLIGGLKIRIGNTIYDGSVSGKLHRIERSILKANN